MKNNQTVTILLMFLALSLCATCIVACQSTSPRKTTPPGISDPSLYKNAAGTARIILCTLCAQHLLRPHDITLLVERDLDGRWRIDETNEGLHTLPEKTNDRQEVVLLRKPVRHSKNNKAYDVDIALWGFSGSMTLYDDGKFCFNGARKNAFFVQLGPGPQPGQMCYKIDYGKVAELIEQTNLIYLFRNYASIKKEKKDEEERIEKEKRDEEERICQSLLAEARNFLDTNILVEPQLTDRSGFYHGEDVVRISKEIVAGLDCPFDFNQVEYDISIVSNDASFTINMEPQHYRLKYRPEGYSLKPLVSILTKNFKDVYPTYVNEDSSLRIDFDGYNVIFRNKTDKFIQVKSISVYYNDKISNIFKSDEGSMELAPEAFMTPLSIKPMTAGDFAMNSNYSVTADLAKKQLISFGFAIKYRLIEQNIDKTLYKQKKYNLYEVLSLRQPK